MTKINTGGPAFPTGDMVERDEKGVLHGYPISSAGMTIRDYFAAKALQGLLAGRYRDTGMYNLKEVPEEAYLIADAMLAARKAVEELAHTSMSLDLMEWSRISSTILAALEPSPSPDVRREALEDEGRLGAAVAALAALTSAGIPQDIQELLVRGDVAQNIAPGSLSKAIAAAIRALSTTPLVEAPDVYAQVLEEAALKWERVVGDVEVSGIYKIDRMAPWVSGKPKKYWVRVFSASGAETIGTLLKSPDEAKAVAQAHFDKHNHAAIRALSAKPAPSGWRDIASAPKDGTEIIYLTRRGVIGYCRYSPAVFDEDDSCWWDFQNDEEAIPAHWMPRSSLPPAPEGGE